MVRSYDKRIFEKSKIRILVGGIIRGKRHLVYEIRVWKMRQCGAQVGDNVCVPSQLVKKANSNLVIGNNTSIQSGLIDTRAKVSIGNHVIIGEGVKIITNSHDIDSKEFELKEYGVRIEDYVWIATDAMILPSCTLIEKGSVIGAGAVVVGDVTAYSIVSGNPAKIIRKRKELHTNLVVESLLGGDYREYVKVYRGKKQYDKYQ